MKEDPKAYAVDSIVPALRKLREERGTHSRGEVGSAKVGPPVRIEARLSSGCILPAFIFPASGRVADFPTQPNADRRILGLDTPTVVHQHLPACP